MLEYLVVRSVGEGKFLNKVSFWHQKNKIFKCFIILYWFIFPCEGVKDEEVQGAGAGEAARGADAQQVCDHRL